MPNKHFYFSVGAAHGALLVVLFRVFRYKLAARYRFVRRLYRWDRDWFLNFPVFIGMAGVYGLIPDILYVLGIFPKNVTREPVFNIFFFHSYFEELENTNKTADWILNAMGSVLLFAIALGVVVFYIRLAKEILHNDSRA